MLVRRVVEARRVQAEGGHLYPALFVVETAEDYTSVGETTGTESYRSVRRRQSTRPEERARRMER